jgi:hypothetical protein
MLSEIRTGPIASTNGAVNPARGANDGSLIIAPGGADYQELAYRQQVFSAANQAATATSVGLSTTYTGLCLSNPAGSNKNLVLFQLGVAVVGAPAALSAIGIMAGFLATGVVTHTTPLTPLSTFINTAVATGIGKADAAATLVGTPVIVMPLGVTPITGATAQVINPPVILNTYDLKGSIILPPGAWAALYTSTALSVIAGLTWAEVPV